MNSKFIYTILLSLFVISSCTDNRYENEVEGDGLVRLHANVAKSNPVTRADNEEQAGVGDYYLHYTPVTKTSGTDAENGMNAHKFTCDAAGTFTSANSSLYWDDIKKVGTNPATFYLTNMPSMTFDSGASNEDILFGKTTGWNTALNFTLSHLTAKITVLLWDNTLNRKDSEKKVNFKNAKVVFYPGLITKTRGIDYANGEVIYTNSDKEKATTVKDFTSGTIEVERDQVKEEYNCVLGDPLYVVPQTFSETDSLEITAGEYIYRIPVPVATDNSRAISAGQHLTINIELTEDVVEATATLVDWKAVPDVTPIEVSRVFNIGNWYELKDLMQAINTGYTFKGMVVRLIKDIKIEGQITLGTEKYPFEGIFDGNNKTISNLGAYNEGGTLPRNKGGLFGYTRGATLQNIVLEAPYVETSGTGPTGSLVDTAENTTFFNCKAKNVDGKTDAGVIATGEYVGGLVGIATGESTLINCYSYVTVVGGSDYVGGLIGYSEASITHSCATGEVDSSGATYIGGLAGYQSGIMQYCYAQGKVTGGSQVGGLIGYLDGESSYCYASGYVVGSTDVGGLFGNVGFDGVADKCFWYHTGNVNYDGAGSADLGKTTCKRFTSGTELLGADFLNDPSYATWILVNEFPIFSNMD